jgi:hypothetical protein
MGIVTYLGAGLVIGIGMFLQQVYVNHWYNTPPTTPADWPAGNITFLEIPTTYYEFGKFSEIRDSFDEGFMMYKLKDRENYHFDPKKINGIVHAKTLVPDEKCRRSIICYACYDDSIHMKDMSFSELMESPNYYSQYTRLPKEMVEYFWSSFKLPFGSEVSVTENGFFGNFKNGRITAQIHANPLTSSMAMQAVGYKLWFFISPDLSLSKDGFDGGLTTPVLFPKRAPTRPAYTIHYAISGPGDLIFFPQAMSHIVYTFEGPNALMNFRKLFISNFLASPYTWFSAMFNKVFVNKLSEAPSHSHTKDGPLIEQEFITPLGKSKPKAFTTQLFEHAITRNKELCDKYDVTPFDKQMLDKLDELVAEARAQGIPFANKE